MVAIPTGAGMQKLFVLLAAFGLIATPAVAQNAQAAQAPQDQAPAAPEKPKTVKKQVCKDVDEERGIGSRLAPTTKICRMIEVPVTQANQQKPRDGEVR
jgi:hypothetical protein